MLNSIGHSNRAFSEFLQKLKENKINVIVDVRTFPRSRFCPHFNRKTLEKSLLDNNIKYLYRGKNLGGYGENIEYEETIDELVELSKQKNVCVMCSEADYKKCHRHLLLEPSFLKKGVKINHIEY